MHLNFRGYQSKKISFEAILRSFDPSINYINICESHFQHKRTLNIPGYQSYTRNRTDKSHGGIASSIIESEANECLKVAEGKESNEFLITRHNQFLTPINIINFYGEQEGRTPADVIEEHWKEIVDEVVKIEARGEHLIMLGDFN